MPKQAEYTRLWNVRGIWSRELRSVNRGHGKMGYKDKMGTSYSAENWRTWEQLSPAQQKRAYLNRATAVADWAKEHYRKGKISLSQRNYEIDKACGDWTNAVAAIDRGEAVAPPDGFPDHA